MTVELVTFILKDRTEVPVPLEPVGTFDARVRAALAARWPQVEAGALSMEAHAALELAGLINAERSPAQYCGKYLYIGVRNSVVDGRPL